MPQSYQSHRFVNNLKKKSILFREHIIDIFEVSKNVSLTIRREYLHEHEY